MNIRPGMIGEVHLTEGVVLAWYTTGNPSQYQAHAANMGAVARRVKTVDQVPDGFSGPLTIDEDGTCRPLRMPPTVEELERREAEKAQAQAELVEEFSDCAAIVEAILSRDAPSPSLFSVLSPRAQSYIEELHADRLALAELFALVWKHTSFQAGAVPPE